MNQVLQMKKATLISLVIGGWLGLAIMQQVMADTSVIGGGALENARGAVRLNIVAGNMNAQSNLAGITLGSQMKNGVRSFQKVGSGFNAVGGLMAFIEGKAFVGVSGLTQVNQVSGSGNEEANTALVGIGSLQPMQPASLNQQHGLSDNSVIQEGGDGSRKVGMTGQAFNNASGVLQVSQVAGNGNRVANSFSLQIKGATP